jgi:hypothetical protein
MSDCAVARLSRARGRLRGVTGVGANGRSYHSSALVLWNVNSFVTAAGRLLPRHLRAEPPVGRLGPTAAVLLVCGRLDELAVSVSRLIVAPSSPE